VDLHALWRSLSRHRKGRTQHRSERSADKRQRMGTEGRSGRVQSART
jgi:hypothetical protein